MGGKEPSHGEVAGKMSFYAEDGTAIRAILEAKIKNILESDIDRDMIQRFVPFVRLLKEISTTVTGEERKDLNVLYMMSSSIYTVYYTYMISTNASRAQSSGNLENLKLIDEHAENFVKAINVVSETFLTELKEILSTNGNKDRATELFENTYNHVVEDVLHIFTL